MPLSSSGLCVREEKKKEKKGKGDDRSGTTHFGGPAHTTGALYILFLFQSTLLYIYSPFNFLSHDKFGKKNQNKQKRCWGESRAHVHDDEVIADGNSLDREKIIERGVCAEKTGCQPENDNHLPDGSSVFSVWRQIDIWWKGVENGREKANASNAKWSILQWRILLSIHCCTRHWRLRVNKNLSFNEINQVLGEQKWNYSGFFSMTPLSLLLPIDG